MDKDGESSAGGRTPSEASQSIQFHFEKSRFFRVIRADGVWGGLTHRGDIHMAWFSEYPAIPESVEHVVRSGKLAEERERKVESGIVRELEVEALINLNTAISVRDWLSNVIENAQKRLATTEQKTDV